MATVDKNFKVKHGLVVEGTTATVNGDNIVTATAEQTLSNKTILGPLEIKNGAGNVVGSFGGSQSVANITGVNLSAGDSVGISAGNEVSLGAGGSTGYALGVDATGAYVGSVENNIFVSANKVATQGYVDGAVPDNTDGLSEGSTNKYFTDQRAKDAAASLITNATKTNIVITGDGNGLTITAENGVADSTTDDLDEGTTNKYFTNQRAFDAVETLFQRPMGPGTGINVGTYVGPTGPAEISINRTVVDTWYDAAGAATTAESNAKSYTDNLIGDPTVNGTSGNTVKDRIDSAVAGLVDGAPALLDTLNELAAAIADNPNYATDMATNLSNKQDTLTAGNGIALDTNDTISANVDGLTIVNNGGTSNNLLAVPLGDGLTVGSLGVAVDTNTIASVSYVDTNFVNVSDLPGQLSDYVPTTQKGSANGVATLDGSGQVPLNQLGNVPAAYVTSVGTNLSVTGGELDIATTPTFTAVDFSSVAKQVAAKVDSIGATAVTLYSFKIGPYSDAYSSAEYTISTYATQSGVPTTTPEREITKILLTTDNGGNVAITEYGTVTLNNHVLDVTAEVVTIGGDIGMGGYYQCNLIASSAISGVTVDHATVVGTLFK